MTREARTTRCPENVLAWIPWYSDEASLDPSQKGAVEAHAAECPDCRAEIDMISGAPFEIDVALPDPDQAFAEITARIAAQPGEGPAPMIPNEAARPDPAADARLARIADWLDAPRVADESPASEGPGAGAGTNVVRGPWASSRSWAAAAAIALLSVGAVLGVIGGGLFGARTDSSDDVYYTASAPEAAPLAGVAGIGTLDVVFREDASAREISDALRGAGAEIVAGPTNLGVYRVRLLRESRSDGSEANASAGPSAAAVAAAAARLTAAEGGVAIFAEAVP